MLLICELIYEGEKDYNWDYLIKSPKLLTYIKANHNICNIFYSVLFTE